MKWTDSKINGVLNLGGYFFLYFDKTLHCLQSKTVCHDRVQADSIKSTSKAAFLLAPLLRLFTICTLSLMEPLIYV